MFTQQQRGQADYRRQEMQSPCWRELAKDLKPEVDLNQFSRMLTTLTVDTAFNAELTDHLGHGNSAPKLGINTRNHYFARRCSAMMARLN
jgi:transposase-like protein